MTGLDDITKARIRRKGEAALEPLDDAIEEAALAAIDCDRAFDAATTIICATMHTQLDAHLSAVEDAPDVDDDASADIHAIASGIVQMRVRNRIDEILTE